MIRNQSGQSIGGQMISALNGAAFAGTVTVYITIDAGVQVIGSVGSGICTAEGNGYYTYLPTASETNGALIAFTFIGSGAIPATIQVATVTEDQQTALQTSSASGAKSVRTLCTEALGRINVLQSNDSTAPPDLLAIAFDRFNDLVDSICVVERLAIYQVVSSPFTIVSSKVSYSVGIGGDINIARPVYLQNLTFTDSAVQPPFERPIVMLTDDAWALIPIKTLTGPYPTYGYYNPTFNTGGLATLNLWMIPTSSTLTGNIYAAGAVTRFGSLSDTIALPPGYNRFLRDNLAVELAGELRENVPIDPNLIRSAAQSKANIKRANIRLQDMAVDPMWLQHGGVRSNIYAGP